MQTKLKIAAFFNHVGGDVQQNTRNRLLDLIAVPLRVISIISILGLASCGGGGGSDGDSSAAPSGLADRERVVMDADSNALSFSIVSGDDQSLTIANRAPVLTGLVAVPVLEGSVKVASLKGADPDGNALSFSILSGDDQSLFRLTPSGDLSFDIAPDFETPADADGDNEYSLLVQATDGVLTANQSLVINVTDAFEGRVVDAPIAEAEVFIDFNANNEQDEGEPNGTTDANGYFKFPLFIMPEGSDAKIVSRGGIDSQTGKRLPNLVLISDVPEDLTEHANVTALTTVLYWTRDDEETARALNAMKVSGGVEALHKSDGWKDAEDGDDIARANQRANQQVAVLFQTATALADDDDDSTDVAVSLTESVARNLFASTQTEDDFDLKSSKTIQNILSKATEEVTPTVVYETDMIEAVAESVAMLNQVVGDTELNPVSTASKQVVEAGQNGMQEAVTSVTSGETSVAEFSQETSPEELFQNVEVTEEAPDSDDDGFPDVVDFDDDNDGVLDTADSFPRNAAETLDTDGDGTGNNADSDDDNDGVADASDAFPLDPNETLDTDTDGLGNNADNDDDGDGVADSLDAFPLNEFETVDTDSDGTGNNADADDDNDGVADAGDAFPLDPTETVDTDADGVGNNADRDDDGDGVEDALDAFPLNNSLSVLPSVDPAPVDPAPVDPAEVDPAAVDPAAVDPAAVEPATVDPAAVDPAAADPAAVDPAAVDPAAVDPAAADPAAADPAAVDPAAADPATVDPAPVELVAELTVAEALWRPSDRWIVEGDLTKADGTTDVGGFVIAELVKPDGTRIEIGRATVDIVPVPGFDIANKPISPAILNNVDVANDRVEVSAISSDGLQQFKVVSFINAPPAPIPHVGTEVVLEAVEILFDNRIVIHGYASFQDAPAAGVAIITTDQSNQRFEVALTPGPDPLAGGFDFVQRPISGNGGFIQGETLTVSVDGVGSATSLVDLSADAVFIPAVADPVVVAALETTVAGLAPVDPAAVDPATVDPATVDPATVDPAAVDPATVDPATVDPATVDPAPVDPAAVDPASVELVAELTVAEALWRPFNRWIVEGNLTKADGTTDVGGFVIAELVKAAGTRIEIGRATVDILPVPGFDIANRPISPAILNNVDVEKDHVEVSAISSDGSQQFKVVSFINAAPEPIAHVGTEVVLEAVEILTDNRVVIHGYASFQGAAATGVAVITTDVSNQLFEAELVPAPDPLAGGFDFVKRPIFGNGGFIDGETLTVTVDDVGFATSVVDLSAETVFIPAVADPVVVAALETTVAGLAPVDPAAVDPATVDPAAVDPAAVDPAPIHVEPLPISPITSASEATTHGLQSLRTAVISDGGVPLPGNLGDFVRDREAAIKLGKALFWDMQMGSDGIQACASCHYKAGADGRSQNQMNPDMLSFVNEREGDIKGYFDAQSSPDTVFHTAGPNESVVASDYPFVKKIQDYVQNDDGSIGPAPGNSNDITSSMGVFLTLFKGSVEAQAVDWGDRLEDPVFNAERADNAVYMANGNTIRRVPHRNAPSTYNAVFNFTNFWDGRANPDFNGQNSFGQQDQNAKVWVQQSDGSVLQEAIVMNNASLASQAVGPALSHFEMSFGNPSAGNARTFPEIGKKLLRGSAPIVPLGQQIVDPDDSVLGALSLSPSPGLNVDYKTLVYAAFKPEYWGFDGRFELNQAELSSEVTAGYLVVETIEGTSTEATATEASSPDAVDELSTYGQYLTAPDASTEKARFTQAEANFAMIFGISVMMYESTLISDQTPYDQWMETGELNDGFGAEELNGLNVFTGKAGCVACHVGPELTNATVRYARDEIIEPMPMAEGFALYDNGFYNLGVTPTTDDIGRGGKDLNGKPLAFSRQALFNRSGIQSLGFPIKGNETVPTTGELGNIVCTDADADGFCDSGTSIVPEFQRVAVDGAFKTPGLRNSELTGPYFHNGGVATLKQVVEFYDRGGNFCGLNLHDLSPDMSPLGLSDVEKDELTAFMVALTDDRVKYSKAPFDHPQLLIPTDGFQDSLEELHEIPAVGAGGSEAALTTFLGLDPQDSIFTPEGICSNGAVPHL